MMRQARRTWLVIVLACASEVWADPIATEPPQALVIKPHVKEEEYCRDRNGVDQVRLSVGLTYSNRGSQTLIVPILVRLSQVGIQGEQLSQPIRLRHKLRAVDGISPEIYRTATPNPKLFWVLSPGESREGPSQFVILRIVGRERRAQHAALHPGEYRFEADLNLGPRLPHDPVVPADLWKGLGMLMLGNVHSEAITVKIDEPKHGPCVTPRVIM